MHIILSILALLSTVFFLYRRFNEAGFTASDINPFLFFRRRSWHKRSETNPLFILEDNADIAAALFFIIAKLDGELTIDSKQALQNDYQSVLNMSKQDAIATLQQTSFMLEQYPIVRGELKKILHKECVARFSSEQAYRLINQLPIIAERESVISTEQQQWINDIEKLLAPVNGQEF